MAGETSEVVHVVSTTAMPAVMGDPLREDALSALISLTGGDVHDWSLRKEGRHSFVNKLGPFEYMEVREGDADGMPEFLCNHPSYGGRAVLVVSEASVKVDSFGQSVELLLRVRDALSAKIRHIEFVESMKADCEVSCHTAKPVAGGWSISLVARTGDGGLCLFRLELRRMFKGSRKGSTIVPVEVDV